MSRYNASPARRNTTNMTIPSTITIHHPSRGSVLVPAAPDVCSKEEQAAYHGWRRSGGRLMIEVEREKRG